jgi:hypothetical protein
MSVFTETMTLDQFGASKQLSSLDLINNPKTGKLFAKFSNGETARLAKDVSNLDGDLSVSWFTPEDGADASWMIHRTGASANVVATKSFGKVATPAPAFADLESEI